MFSKAKTRVSAVLITRRRNPGKVCAPADPASTTVVAPLAIQFGSAGMPSGATPSYTWTWISTSPGVTILPRASITIRASEEGMFASNRATLPPETPTSRGADKDCDGSITRPPLISRSYRKAWALDGAARLQRRGRNSRLVCIVAFIVMLFGAFSSQKRNIRGCELVLVIRRLYHHGSRVQYRSTIWRDPCAH